MKVSLKIVAESGRDRLSPVSKLQIQPGRGMSGLTLDGTAEPISRGQIPGTNGDKENFVFSVQLTTSRIDITTRLMPMQYVESDGITYTNGWEILVLVKSFRYACIVALALVSMAHSTHPRRLREPMYEIHTV